MLDTKNRWIIVSNRLPLEVKNDEIIRGSGGLITAITGIDSTNPILWAGLVPGEDIEGEYLTSLKKLKDKIQYHPIFIKKKEYHKYYNGFCNDVLWPLLHYETEYVRYDLSNWNTYVEVNKKIAKNLSTLVQTNDIVWIHDFHLLLVPKFLKKIKPNCKVGFFLHIPFPSYEIFRQLPMANYILEGVLWSDLIGFHDYSYLRYFVSSVRGVLGIYPTKMQIEFKQHQTKLGVFPASINYQIFREISKSKETELLMDKWKQSSFEIEKVILGVDRLDYTKGIDLKLKAYEVFLEKYPQWQGRIQLLQLATPTRTEVPEYIKLKNEIDMTIGRINGKFGTANYVPIKYIFNSVTPEELAALYSHADVLLVTSKRDGMNLVALEYIVSQNNVDPGVVILSEFTGAVSHLSEAISINPWNIYETADAIFHAINIPLPEKIRKNEIMKKFLFNYTATTWAQRFIRELEAHRVIDQKTRYINSEENIPTEIQAAIKKHRSNLLLLLDYDGTLTPIRSDPAKALLTLRARRLIHKFAITDNVDVCIISGRDRDFLKSLDVVSRQAFNQINKKVSTNYFSMNGDVARLTMNVETTDDLGDIITIDHYVKSPKKLTQDINDIGNKSQGSVVLGEFGAPIPDIHGEFDDAQQAAWLESALSEIAASPKLIGVNYWVNAGGSTALWDDDGKAHSGVRSLAKFFKPDSVFGVVSDELGKPIIGAIVKTSYRQTITDKRGYYQLPFLADKNAWLEVSAKGYNTNKITMNNQRTQRNVTLKLSRESLTFKAKKLNEMSSTKMGFLSFSK